MYRLVLAAGLLVLICASDADAQSATCGAYAFAGKGAWGAARGFPDCESAKNAAFAACQRESRSKDERDDCLITPLVGANRWFDGAVCYQSDGRRMMAPNTFANVTDLQRVRSEQAAKNNYNVGSCTSHIQFHSDDRKVVTSGRGY